MNCQKYEYTNHCLLRAIERDISIEVIENIIKSGELIREYKDDKPYPSFLILGFKEEKPIHVLVAISEETCIVITVYIPDSSLWDNSFKIKK